MTAQRNKAVVFLAIAGIGLILLALSLPGLQFKPGLPIPGAEPSSSQNSPAGATPTEKTAPLLWVLQSSLSLVFIALLVFLVVGLIRTTNIRQLLKIGIGLVVLLALLFLLPKIIPAQQELAPSDGNFAAPPSYDYSIAPIGNPPARLYWFVVAGLLLCFFILGAWLLLEAMRKPADTGALAEAAGAALQAIQGGQDLGDVIITCYLQMVNVVKDEHGLEREETVTPREFENLLAYRGVPVNPTRQLTRLFEKARYGRYISGVQDEQAAIESLSAIQIYCQQNRRKKA